MKTLDEVIKAVDYCRFSSDCNPCPYKEDKECSRAKMTDALHYLKDYQRYRNTPSRNGHMALVDYFEEPQKNEPLTWDELCKMEGKPVFVEERYRNGDLKSSGWWLIDFWNDDQICLRDQGGNPWNDHRSNYGREWQAYRKERE